MPSLTVTKRVSHTLDPLLFGVDTGQSSQLSDINWRFAKAISDSLSIRQHGLVVTINRLLNSLELVDDDDRPDREAVEATAHLLLTTYSRMSNYFPQGWLTVSPDKSIRVEWWRAERHVRVAIPGKRSGYVYFEERDAFGTEPSSSQALANRLDWLLE